jgi:hypothetical protein
MFNIIEEARRFLRRSRGAIPAAGSDDQWRGQMQRPRRDRRAGPSVNDDEHAQWLGFADRPSLADLERAYRDGVAGIEP